MTPQIKLQVTLASRDGYVTVDILIDGNVELRTLHARCLHAVTAQHPHHAGKPIANIRYDVKANR